MAAETITWLGEKTDTTDKASLCDSKHRLNVGIVKIDGKIIPFESYIVVQFEAMDTEGGVIGGVMTEAGCMWNNLAYVATANQFTQWAGHGLADWSRDRGVVYGEGLEGGTAKFVNEGLFNMGGNAATIYENVDFNPFDGDDDSGCYITTAVMQAEGRSHSPELTSMRILRDKHGIWFAENEVREYYQKAPTIVQSINNKSNKKAIYRHLHSEYITPAHNAIQQGNMMQAHNIYRSMVKAAEQFAAEPTNTAGEPCEFQGWGGFWGTDFHPENADQHKTMITIENEFEGVKSTVFKGPLAACMMSIDANDECNMCCNMKSFNRYFVTQPGKWKVKASAVGSGICAKPTYNFEWSFDVPKPDDWDEKVAVNPIQTMSQDISATLQEAGVPFHVSPLAIVGTASLVGGLLLFKIYKKKKAKAE